MTSSKNETLSQLPVTIIEPSEAVPVGLEDQDQKNG